MAEIGWQKIGEIADVIGKGIEGILQELREILNRAGEAAGNQLDRIENFVRDVFMTQESEEFVNYAVSSADKNNDYSGKTTMSLYPDLDNLDLTKLINCFHKTFPDGEIDDFAYFGDVALHIRQQGKAGIDFLLEQLDKANLEQLRGIIVALTFPPPVEDPSLQDRLLSYLQDRRPLIVADAVDGLRFLEAKDAADAVLPLSTHPDPYVRGSVLRFISHLFPLSAPPILLKALQDPDYIVRENAIDELDDLGAIAAIPYIRPFLSDPHPDVVQAAQTAISNLEETLHK